MKKHIDDMHDPKIKKNVKLICKRVRFYALLDEDVFFEWIKRIPSITQFSGVGDEMHLFVTEDEMGPDDVENILALFRRYLIDTHQLRVFLNEENKEWLAKRIQ